MIALWRLIEDGLRHEQDGKQYQAEVKSLCRMIGDGMRRSAAYDWPEVSVKFKADGYRLVSEAIDAKWRLLREMLEIETTTSEAEGQYY